MNDKDHKERCRRQAEALVRWLWPAWELLIALLTADKNSPGGGSPALDNASLAAAGITGEEFVAECQKLGSVTASMLSQEGTTIILSYRANHDEFSRGARFVSGDRGLRGDCE